MTQTSWWHQATAAALLGTSRREPPPLPAELGLVVRPDATPQSALLDAAAVGGALLRARPRIDRPSIEPLAPAPAESLPAAPRAAVQLLALLLDQPPVTARLRPLALSHWLGVAAHRGVRAPHSSLVRLLETGTQQRAMRPAIVPVLGARGRWLAGLRPDWVWVADLPVDLAPGPGADTVEVPPIDEWRSLSAADRTSALDRLPLPLPDPALALLEAALDDRSEKVRRQAGQLLDAAPGSERALRMAARLRPLVTSAGRLRRTLEIALPLEPDATGVRDGLTTTRAGSQRERWLELISAGAPLSVWTDASGKDPAHTWPLITQPAARAGVLRAIRARGDAVWASAAAADAPDLLGVLPLAERDATALHLIRAGKDGAGVASVIRQVPAPWSAALSSRVIDHLRHSPPIQGYGDWLLFLAEGLHATAAPAVSAWARSENRWGSLPADLDQYLSFLPAITEAFR